jgi:hypothetical protein
MDMNAGHNPRLSQAEIEALGTQRRLRAEAERKIEQELRLLQDCTGLSVTSVCVEFLDVEEIGERRRRLPGRVVIRMEI